MSAVPQKMKTPPIIIDPDLIKSTSEHNRKNTSPIGEMFGYRTPNVTDVEPIPLPRFTPERKPERWEVDVDRTTPLVKLIQPRTDLLRTPDKISTWFKNNITIFNKPSHYVGHEANTDAPTLYDTSDLRILIVRLSAYDAVAGSMTHGAIAQMVRQSARDHNFSVYIDHAYMPSLNGDMKIMQEQKIPWWFGRTSKRHPRDFDAILVSNALTLEIWNIIPGLIYSGIAPFKTMRGTDTKIGDPVGSPLIIVGGVVSDFVESLYGECCGQRCVPDVTLIGDGEYILPRTMNLLHQCKSQGLTKADFLRRGHDLPEDEDFERDSTTRGKTSWWYEPDLYTHTYDKEPDPTTGYRELRSITRNPGHEYAAAPGLIKRSVVRDLNETPVWEEAPLQYDGQLGDSVDIQISSGCLCVAGETVIETQFGFETIKEAYDRQQEEGEFGILIQTRHGLQGAEKIVHTGKKIVRTYKFRDENNQHPYEISCTPEHKFDTAVFGDSEANWTEAGRLEIGQEIAVVDPEHYESARETGGKLNTQSQHYYTAITRYDLYEISDPYEVDCYDIKNCDVHEYIANGLITHNSGGLCSFCLAEGTLITVKNPDPKATSTIQVPIEKLEDTDYQGDIDERYFDTPYGLQRPDGVGYTGEKECIEIKTSLGHTLTGTLDHEVLIHRQGKVQKIQIGDLVVGDKMILISTITKDKVSRDSGRRDFLYPEMQGSRSHQKRQSLERDAIAKAAKARGENAETAVLDAIDQQKQTDAEQKEWLMKVRKANGYEDTITELNRVGLRKVYDVWNIPKGHVFYANGFVVGNCHEAHTQGRWRERSLDVIKQAAERAVRKQGAQMASFYSLTWSLHSHIYSLLAWSYSRFGNTNLISQRADQASADPDFFKYQNQQGENHATVGVEGMSQRMRNYFNKSLHTDQFTRMCENAAWAGYSSLKLFMIMSGLENGDDVQEYCELLRFLHTRFKEIAQERSRQLGREVNPPKLSPSFMLLLNAGHTSLQWAPCTSSFDLENNSLAPVVQTTRECGFGFRTALTRDRVRHSQWSCMAGRESTEVIADVGLRCNFVNYGPIQPQVTWRLHEALQERGYDWMYFFREKFWNQVLPWDAIQTPMRRDYLWNQWLAIRKFLGIAYCLKTSINLNPKCHDCAPPGSMVTMADGTVKAIEDVQLGDRVLTGSGKPTTVVRALSRDYEGPLKVLHHSNGYQPLALTGNHKVPVRLSSMLSVQDRRDGSLKRDDFHKLEVENHSPGDVLYIPTPQGEGDVVVLTDDELELLGWYGAEGNQTKWQGIPNGIKLSLGKDEPDEAQEVYQLALRVNALYPWSPGPNHRGVNGEKETTVTPPYMDASKLVIRVFNPNLAQRFKELLGEGSHHKKLSQGFYNLLINHERSARLFIRRLVQGDGGIRDDEVQTCVTLSLASRQLMEQTFWVLVAHGFLALRKNFTSPGGPTNRDKKSHQFRWRISKQHLAKWWPELSQPVRSVKSTSWKIASSIATEITKITEQQYKGKVHNLTVVDPEHTYVLNGVSVGNCGACGTGEDKKFMLTRPLETSDTLHGKEAARRDMTVRKRVRFDLEITDTSLRLALKSILARHLVRAMMLAASEPEDQGGLGFENRIVSSFLRVDDHSLKHAEGMNSLPWVGGHVLVDIVFNDNWPDPLLRRLLPRINEILNETFPPDAPGYTLNNFSSGEKLESLNGKVFQLLTIELPIPAYDLRSALEVYDEKESISYKAKVNVAKDVMRTEVVTRIRSEVIPMALIQSPNRHGGHTRLTYLCTLGANPMQVLLSLTSKPPRIIKGNPLISLGIFKPMEPEADDIWAELEERSTACSVTGEPIELDVFTGERYRSISGANLCLAADLKGLLQMREQGIKIGGATITV
jgi:hypothetical protein